MVVIFRSYGLARPGGQVADRTRLGRRCRPNDMAVRTSRRFHCTERASIDSFAKARKSPHRTGNFPMRGLSTALFACDFPRHDAHHRAGREAASLISTKTMAKKTTTTV